MLRALLFAVVCCAPAIAWPHDDDEKPAEDAGVSIRFRVTDFDGAPLSGAEVRLTDGEKPIGEERTDETGVVKIARIPRRDVRLSVSADQRFTTSGVVHAAETERPPDRDHGPVGFVHEWTPETAAAGGTPVVAVVLPRIATARVGGAPPKAHVVALAVAQPLEIKAEQHVRMSIHTSGEESLLGAFEADADDEGRCTFAGLPGGATVIVRAQSDGLATKAVARELDEAGADLSFDLPAAEAAWVLAGTVRDAEGRPVAGARVIAAPADCPRALADPTVPPESPGRDHDDVPLAWTATTDANGGYEIPHLLRGRAYAVRAEGAGSVASPVTWDVRQPQDGDTTVVDLAASKPVALRIRIADADGVVPKRGVARLRTLPRDDGRDRVVRLDGGTIAFEGVVPGRYLLLAEGEGILDLRREVVATGAADPVAVVAESGAVIAGRVADLDGKPVAGALVQAFDPDVEAAQVIRYPFGEQSTESAADGTFRLGGLTAKLWNVRVSAGDEVASILAPTTAPAKDVVLKVGPRPRLRFGVKLPEGMTLRDIKLGVFRLVGDGTPYAAGTWDREALTETTVAFRDLPADEDVIVRFVVPGHPPYMQSMRLAPGESRDLGTLEPPVGQTVEGVVRDSAGKSVAGVDVTARHSGKEEAVSDAEGRFRLENVAPGQQELRASKFGVGNTVSGEQAVVLPAKEPVVIVVRRHPDVAGVVVDRAGRPVAAQLSFVAIRPWGRLQRPRTETAEADGKFAVVLEPGRYRVFVTPQGAENASTVVELEITEVQEKPLRLMIDPAAR